MSAVFLLEVPSHIRPTLIRKGRGVRVDPLSVHVRAGDPLIHLSGFVWASGLTHLPTPQASDRPGVKAGSFSHQTTALNKGQGLGSLQPIEPCVSLWTYSHIPTCTTVLSEWKNKNPLTWSSVVFPSNTRFHLNLHCKVVCVFLQGFVCVCVFLLLCVCFCVHISLEISVCLQHHQTAFAF
ncbi:hypothetical protein AMECASPLE_017975 [Ameca splendens]|uniref:Uncharacterized protein n=1 Tax=Ameca splendens TaxID=208324 RepID=A0ABV0YQ12_9TELE